MKKIHIALLAAPLVLNSCITSTKTATTLDIHPSVRNATVADLTVAPERITYRMSPSKAIQRGGIENVKQAAENEALQKNGNADILVEPQFVYSIKNGRVKSIEVTGRPAYYTNFRSLSDTVWSNPYFNGLAPVIAGGGGGRSGKGLFGNFLGNKSEKEATPKKTRNPYRSTGFHAHFEFEIGPSLTTGKPVNTYFVPRSYGNGGGYALTLGYQIDEQFYLGVGAAFFTPGINEDYILGSEERYLNRFFEREWTKYSYSRHENSDHYEQQPEKQTGNFSFSEYEDAVSGEFIPIYANARYYFSPTKVSPFADLKLGFSKEVGYKHIDGGLYFSPSIGMGLRRLHVSLKYTLQSAGYSSSFKDDIDNFLGALNSSDNEREEGRSYVQYYDPYQNSMVYDGDKWTASESKFVGLLKDFRDHTRWLIHHFSVSIGIRF